MAGFIDQVLLRMQIHKQYTPQNSSGPSQALWSRVADKLMDGGNRLVSASDDFLAVDNGSSYTEIRSEMGYAAYIDTGGTLLGLADEKGGALALTTDGTDEDEIWLTSGDNTGQLGQISDTAADAHLTAFEARYKINTIADAAMSHFVGLGSPGLAAADTKTDATGALAAASAFIGFDTLLDGDSIQFVTQAASQTVQNVISGVHVPVADTYVKLGFIYDPTAPPSRRIAVYVNNVENATYVTATNIAAATFPDAEALAFLAGYKNTTAVAGELALDWWAYAQVIG